jgi:hypothetical protein
MVASFLLLHPSRARQDEDLEANLGVLLLDFLRLFGRTLNVNEVGISCRCVLPAEVPSLRMVPYSAMALRPPETCFGCCPMAAGHVGG